MPNSEIEKYNNAKPKTTDSALLICEKAKLDWPGFPAKEVAARLRKLLNKTELDHLLDLISNKKPDVAQKFVVGRVEKLFDL